MTDNERDGWKVVQLCDSRQEADTVIDTLRAALPGPFGKRRQSR
jgi:hypothetical protein